MTIQISVVIWTIICFVLLMLILNNLLFKPVLDIMDKRREKIAAAKAKKAERESLIAENERLVAEKKAEHKANEKKLIKERVEKVQSDRKKAVEAAKEVRLHKLDETRRNTDAEEKEILSKLGAHSEELAVMLADRIVKG
ncbi:MAG: hypothetical protein IJB24_04830 [Clostridia bacterium]|nr:hypothetical protein [Clostridia bacterium]MBQ4602168.1 hypothetical protein [Clostridia bacterium]